jgi:3-deoxy-D-manno-octulosonate 8-phosphate phosphatase KdsC-like HAD superfamily phosphatase
VTLPIRLLAVDIDGTLLNSEFRISQRDIDALRYAHASGVEVILVTGRRHTFALPMAHQLGFGKSARMGQSRGRRGASIFTAIFCRLKPAATSLPPCVTFAATW